MDFVAMESSALLLIRPRNTKWRQLKSFMNTLKFL